MYTLWSALFSTKLCVRVFVDVMLPCLGEGVVFENSIVTGDKILGRARDKEWL